MELADQRGGSADPAQTVETREIYATIARLPDDFRDVLIAIDIVGLSYQEAATALGQREGTIISRLHRARRRVCGPARPCLKALCGGDIRLAGAQPR